jgi:hypothetical protein
MTKAIGRFNEESTRIHATRTAYAALCEARKDQERAVGKEERIRARIVEITGRLDIISTEITRLSSDPSLQLLDAERGRYADLVRQRDDHLRHYASLTMTASHVFRKAEKIATRKHLSKEVHLLKDAMDILSDHTVASAELITHALDAACPVVQKMIDDGDIILKNKEEHAVFSDSRKFCGEVSGLCRRYRDLEARCREAEEGFVNHPVLARLRSLEREKEQLKSMQVHEEEEHRQLLLWRTRILASSPLLQEELVKKLKEMIGETVQLKMGEPVRG